LPRLKNGGQKMTAGSSSTCFDSLPPGEEYVGGIFRANGARQSGFILKPAAAAVATVGWVE